MRNRRRHPGARQRPRPAIRTLVAGVVALTGVAVSVMLTAAPAAAHSYAATVFADVSEPERGVVRTVLDIEYVLLATDGARAMGDTAFEQEAYADVQASGRDPEKLTPAVLDDHADSVEGYVLPRFSVSVAQDGEPSQACPNAMVAPYEIVIRDGVPHARLVIEADCTAQVEAMPVPYRITTELFPGTAPGGMTTTIVDYDVRSGAGVASLDTDTNPSMVTTTDWGSRMGEFLVLGAEHLLLGPDHLLFLLALIIGSRRLRDIVLAATAFTVAHSATFILAALGVVSIPAWIVETAIALSIAVVALWEMRRFRRAGQTDAIGADGTLRPLSGKAQGPLDEQPLVGGGGIAVAVREQILAAPASAPAVDGFTRGDLLRIGVVFAFGLMHGVGFAGALGIDEPFSWDLLGALLVFNVGIELAQLLVIAAVFPLFVLLRRRLPSAGFWIAAVVAAVGLFWFVERLIAGV